MEDSKVFEDEASDGINALNLKWMIGFNKDIVNGVHSITTQTRKAIFYTSAHTGVIYDRTTGKQRLLQGHCNKISCCAVSLDKRWIVTADSGDDSLVVVWNSLDAIPVRTIPAPYPEGVYRMDISDDGKYLVTLSNSSPQLLTVWDWSIDSEDSSQYIVAQETVPTFGTDAGLKNTMHSSVRLNPIYTNQIATNNASTVIFWQFSEETKSLECYSNSAHQSASFTQTVFMRTDDGQPNQAVTGTTEGSIIVWGMSTVLDAENDPEQRKRLKVVKLVEASVTVLTTFKSYLVLGASDGAVRFYNPKYTIDAWFENLGAKDIRSISFAFYEDEGYRSQDSDDDEPSDLDMSTDKEFYCPSFFIASDNAKVVKIRTKMRGFVPPPGAESYKIGKVVLQGLKYPVNTIAVHPLKPLLAVAGGRKNKLYLQIWDYRTHRRVKFDLDKSRESPVKAQKAEPLYLEYSPDGQYLCMSFSDGAFMILDPDNPFYEKQPQIKYTDHPKAITQIIFNKAATAMATMDREFCVTLFKKGHKHGNKDLPIEWNFHGSRHGHSRTVKAITFGEIAVEREFAGGREDGSTQLRLFSVGDDRYMNEYNTSSTFHTQLELVPNKTTKIEQEFRPTCCIWYPINTGQDLILTMNDAHKIKLWDVNSLECRKTCLGPTYGPVTKLRLLEKAKGDRGVKDYFLAYAADEKIAGLMKLPVNGNPNKFMSLIAHPNKIKDLKLSSDGKFMFTCGGDDLCVAMWYVDVGAIDAQVILGGEGDEPFFNLIEGGKEGQAYRDMKDYFYYSQIKSKQKDTAKAIKLEGSVPLSEIANLMRAMGYYPSEQEIENMKNEAKHSQLAEIGGVMASLDLDTLFKLYVNHRPVYGTTPDQIIKAFETLGGGGTKSVNKNRLFDLLTTEGEALSRSELEKCLNKLLMCESEERETRIPEELSAEEFITNILEFEVVGEEEEEAGVGESQNASAR